MAIAGVSDTEARTSSTLTLLVLKHAGRLRRTRTQTSPVSSQTRYRLSWAILKLCVSLHTHPPIRARPWGVVWICRPLTFRAFAHAPIFRAFAPDFAHLLPNTQDTLTQPMHTRGRLQSTALARALPPPMLVRGITSILRGVPIVEVFIIQVGGTRGGGRIQSTG